MNKYIFLTFILSTQCFGYSSKWSAEKKQEYLWEKIEKTEYQNLPSFQKTDLLGLLKNLWANEKKEINPDIISSDYEKGIHKNASVAKVKFMPSNKNYRSSLFGGFNFGLLRFSLTESPDVNIYKPGIALKVLIDGKESANGSFLVNLDGQTSSNVFNKPYSNIVPDPDTLKGKVGVKLFRLRSKYPTAIKVEHFSKVSEVGSHIDDEDTLKQIFLVPHSRLSNNNNFYGDPRKYLNEFLYPGNILFHVYGRDKGDFNYASQGEANIYLGDIVLDSNFMSSEFGDKRLFFSHEFVD